MTRYKEALDAMLSAKVTYDDDRCKTPMRSNAFNNLMHFHYDTIRQALSSMIEKEDMFALIKTCRDYTQPWAVDSVDDLEVLQKAMKTIHDDMDAMVKKYKPPEGESDAG